MGPESGQACDTILFLDLASHIGGRLQSANCPGSTEIETTSSGAGGGSFACEGQQLSSVLS